MEIGYMWEYPRMWVSFLICTASFAVVSLFCEQFVLIPDYVTIRPVNGFPVTFGLLFGPAGALGCAAGNLLGDVLRGELTWASIGGATGNFLFAFIPYRVWEELRPSRNISTPTIFSWQQFMWFCIVSAAGALVCTAVVAASIWLASGDSFWTTYGIVLENNVLGAYIVGIPLFLVLPLLVDSTDMYWKREMRDLYT